MKAITPILIFFCLLATSYTSSYAQLTKQQIKDKQELNKLTKEELNKKASKEARKEAKRLEKEGWKTAPGALPIERQLDRSYTMISELDSDYMPKFFTEEAMSTARTFEAAKMQATELARQRLAGQIQSEATALVENSVANNQISSEDAETITKTILTGQTLSSQTIGRIIPVVELYRDIQSGKKEVLVRIFYDAESARKMARKVATDQLESQINSSK